MSLSHRERVFRALRGEPGEGIARGEFFISDEFVRRFFLLPENAPVYFSHHRDLILDLDLDLASVSLSAGWGAPGQPDEDLALEELMQWKAAGDRFVFALIDGPFSAAAKARGFNMLMHYVRGAPFAARDLFRQGATDTVAAARAVRDAGADGVILGEDLAYGRSPYISPDQLRELYFPELQSAVHDIRALELLTVFHSDGNLDAILGDLGHCQLDGLQGLEPESGMEIGRTRVRVGETMTLWGNLGYEFLSQPHSQDEITKTVQALCRSARATDRNHFIFGSCPGLVQGLSIDTVRQVYATPMDF